MKRILPIIIVALSTLESPATSWLSVELKSTPQGDTAIFLGSNTNAVTREQMVTAMTSCYPYASNVTVLVRYGDDVRAATFVDVLATLRKIGYEAFAVRGTNDLTSPNTTNVIRFSILQSERHHLKDLEQELRKVMPIDESQAK